jgi:hypothetical protein
MSKELIEQLANKHLFIEGSMGPVYCGSLESLEAFAKAYQAAANGNKSIKTVYECTNCGYWYIGHTVSQCDCIPDKQEFRTMEVFTYDQAAAPIDNVAEALEKAFYICVNQPEVDRPLQEAGGQDNEDNYVSGYVDGCNDCANKIRAIIPTQANTHPEDYMCPNCVTPWKCNGPHLPFLAPINAQANRTEG